MAILVRSAIRRWGLIFGPLALMALPGCGTSSYERLFKESLDEGRRVAPFTKLQGPTPLEGTGLAIRVPKVCKDAYIEGTVVDNAPIVPERLKPPFWTNLPGHKVTYEGTVDDDKSGHAFFYCYLAVLETTDKEAASKVAARVLKGFPNVSGKLESIDCPKLEKGSKVAWKKIRVQGEQPFPYTAKFSATPEIQNQPGTFEMWIYEQPDFLVLVGWRYPDAIAQKLDFDEMAMATAGSIDKAPEEASAEDQPATEQPAAGQPAAK